jgi:tRNA(Ile)-lysidine synthase
MPKISLSNRVAGALRDAGLSRGDRLLVAVSGGVDSMVLLDVLSRLQDRLGLRLHVAHIHHGLRGRAADRDAAFVIAEAARRELGASLCRLDPAERRRGESVQAWARAARYRCLEKMAERVRASRIAVAHTQDDQAETVLLHLLRGTGPRGLGGIPPIRHSIVRPLLSVSRPDVEVYADTRHLAFRQDLSNASDVYRRNRIRHHLLPLLAQEYNPRIVQSLATLATLLRQDDAALTVQAASLLAAGAREGGPAICLAAAALGSAPPAVARRAFQEAFQRVSRGEHGLTRRHTDALQRLLTREGVVRLPGGFLARRSGGDIRIGPASDPPSGDTLPMRPVPARGEVRLRPGVWTPWRSLDCRVRVREVAAASIPPGGRDRWREMLSPRLLDGPITLRAWRPGDRFRPLGMSGQKKLQDFFVDAKVPRPQRGRIPLLVTGGRIAWVIGHRIAEDFRLRGSAKACLVEVEFPAEQRQSKTDN